ncbi:MAG TPA: fused MFS/spermidine synthase [Rhodocyclaceae bacterium]|nr:fused MFS/spermidine synthase [Rhodocyclaceae bacterium]
MSVPIDISEEAGVRFLHFGSEWVQGAMRLRKPWSLELVYTREMMAGLLLHPRPWPRKVLLIGLGAGSLARFVHHHLPDAVCTVVEIAPEVHAVARQFFRLPDENARFRVVIGDGAQYVMDTDAHWDLIAVDGFDRHARAGDLATLPFYQACWTRLSERGVMAVNLFSGQRGFKGRQDAIREAFDGRLCMLPPSETGNAIALAVRGAPIELSHDTLLARAAALKADTGLDLPPTLKRLDAAGGLPDGRLSV